MGATQVRPPESTCNGPILCDFKFGIEYVRKALSPRRSRPRWLPIHMFPSRSSKSQVTGPVVSSVLSKETPFALYRNSPRLVPTQIFESRSRKMESTSRLRREDDTPPDVSSFPFQRSTPFAVPTHNSEFGRGRRELIFVSTSPLDALETRPSWR